MSNRSVLDVWTRGWATAAWPGVGRAGPWVGAPATRAPRAASTIWNACRLGAAQTLPVTRGPVQALPLNVNGAAGHSGSL
eukprot:14754774-Alexandrium_andersonii.AAC.1